MSCDGRLAVSTGYLLIAVAPHSPEVSEAMVRMRYLKVSLLKMVPERTRLFQAMFTTNGRLFADKWSKRRLCVIYLRRLPSIINSRKFSSSQSLYPAASGRSSPDDLPSKIPFGSPCHWIAKFTRCVVLMSG